MEFYKHTKNDKTTVTKADGSKEEFDKGSTTVVSGIAAIIIATSVGIVLVMHPEYAVDMVAHLQGFLKK